ncbi:glycosyltransferase family 4 protein [Salimicrobium halophilum]|uniref:Glycosyltransferase involved in cell wall bisynthesis n=1 Tax=Salimicrobium halophilum TaxID=86666 RepID=A0A1G8SEZ3_9BACI|nr:glycosyltransferase family 4 protein [Salimicrobium halophilum]SDJ27768.1 Glycosyltransferase involved in cell wall bisynthesis [Salimicrobium halophilum]
MRIMMTTVFDYPHTGGLSTHVATLKAGLEELGHEVDVVSFTDVPDAKKQVARGSSFLLNKVSKGKGIIAGHRVRQQLLEVLIKRKAEDKAYDIINAQDVYASLASFKSGVPVVSTVHGYLAFEAVSRGAVSSNSKEAKHMQELEREVYRQTRRPITVDQRIKDYIQELAGVEGERIYNFINVDQFQPQVERREELRASFGYDSDDVLLFIPRRMTRKNGVIFPAKALSLIHEKYPRVRLLYAGSGEEEQNIRDIARETGVEDHVHFLGNIPHETMKDYYAMSNATLIPSIHSEGVEEATSISALEGMGAGVPVVASGIGGLKELIDDGENGLLVEEQSPEAIRDAVFRIIEQPEEGEQMAKAARALIEENYSHHAAAEKFAKIYESVL